MGDQQERRRAPRVTVSGQIGARARATLEVRLVDLSVTGARIGHAELLRPGTTCALRFPPAIGSLVLSARVVHSIVVGATALPRGERRLRYQSGLAFLDTAPKQQAALNEIVRGLTPGGGLGDARAIN